MSIEEHQKDYFPDAWRDYDIEEYVSWISLLAKRSTHRNNVKKAKNDLEDARNYMWMLEQALEENFKE